VNTAKAIKMKPIKPFTGFVCAGNLLFHYRIIIWDQTSTDPIFTHCQCSNDCGPVNHLILYAPFILAGNRDVSIWPSVSVFMPSHRTLCANNALVVLPHRFRARLDRAVLRPQRRRQKTFVLKRSPIFIDWANVADEFYL
jgi:hypothetical protein